jgi:hypothetical protein
MVSENGIRKWHRTWHPKTALKNDIGKNLTENSVRKRRQKTVSENSARKYHQNTASKNSIRKQHQKTVSENSGSWKIV